MAHRKQLGAPLALATALLFLAPALLSAPAAALTVTTFEDGTTSRVVTLVSANATDNATRLSVLKDSRVVSASLHAASVLDSAGLGPSDVRVFAATPSPSQQIWGFSGTGYGGLGTQTLYSDGSSTQFFDADGQAPATFNTSVLLPLGANVTSTYLRLENGRYDAGFLPPVPLNHTTGPLFSGQINMNGSAVPYLVDIDADGDLDLYAGGGWVNGSDYRSSGPKFFRNVGNASSYRFAQDPTGNQYLDPYWYHRPALADLDGDGDFEITLMGGSSSSDSYIWLWKNFGTIYSPSWGWNGTVFLNMTSDSKAVPTYADLDGDGDMDLVIGEQEGRLTMYENIGSATRPVWQFLNLFRAIDVGSYAAPNFADYDGDGDLDLVIGNETDLTGTANTFNTSRIRLWENVGTRTSPSFQLSDAFDGLPVPAGGNWSRPSPFLADMDADGDLDMIVGDWEGRFWYYEGRASWPSNITVDVGADGVVEATLPGGGPGYANITNLAAAFNYFLNLPGAYLPDAWGNAMVQIPLSVTTQTDGLIWLHRLYLRYAYDATTPDFAGLLDAARAAGTPSMAGTVSVPLLVAAGSPGSLRLHTPRVELDLAPTFQPPTSMPALDEDTRAPNLLDLATVFSDDFTGAINLTYAVVANSAQGTIGAAASGRWLDIDASTGAANDNWNGYLNVTVRATDARGLFTDGTITVWVRPVNDAPTLSPLVGTHSLYEDEPWQIFPQGEDVDGDPLTWSLSSFPGGPQINATTGAVHWTPTSAHVGEHTIRVTVSDGALSASADILLIVHATNDPPLLLPFPTVTVEEGVPFSFDLAPYIVDDDPLAELTIAIQANHTSLAGTVISGTIPVGLGIQVEKVHVQVTDPDGETARGTLALVIVPAGPRLALVGVPDLQVVESVPKTLDITPYVKNAKALANVTLSEDSPYATVAGLRVTFLVPVGTPEDVLTVRLTVSEGDATASWTILVTVVRLGSTLLLADLPDVDVIEGVEVVVDLRPYLHNVLDWGALAVESSSPRAWVTGTALHLLYPSSYAPPSELVTLTAREGSASSSDALVVFVHRQGQVLTVDPLPAVTVLEGEPYSFSLSPYIRGADPLSDVTVAADSAHATTEGLVVTLLYPKGSGLAADHIVVTTRFRGRSFASVLEVTVLPWQDAFLFGGVPNVIVVAGVPLTLALSPYLHNLGERPLSAVQVTASSPRVSVGAGPALTFLYDGSWEGRSEVVEVSATLDGVTRRQSIEVRVRPQGTGLGLAPLPDQQAREDEPLAFDVAPFVLNMPPGGVTVLADSSFATVSGTVVTFLFPQGADAVHVWITVMGGADAAQGLLVVRVEAVNDAPRLVGTLQDQSARVGDRVVFDLSHLFDDEESGADLILQASDSRVVIDAEARIATFLVPAEGVFEIVFTAVDPVDGDLTVSAPAVSVTGRATPTPHAPEAGLGLAWLFLLVAAVAGAVLYLRWRGRRPAD